MSKIKKTVVVILSLILFMLFPISASALSSGGAELTATGQTLQYYPSGTNITAESSGMTETDDDQIVFTYLTNFSYSGQVMHELFFNFNSSITSGDLTIEFMTRNGSVLSDVKYVGLVDQDNWKFLGDGTYDIITDNTGRVKYSGQIPTNISLRLVYDYTSNEYGAYIDIVTKFIFVPENQADKIIQNQEENTEDIINNQNENADKIIQGQEQLQENEKNEAQSSGNSAADDVTAVIPNKSQGFMDVLKGFVKIMSTSDTECKITFPSIKVPAIDGLFSETVLTKEMEVDFSSVISLIPTSILEVIRAITTIALIAYCFKELYDTISEALTRRQQNE